MGDVLFSQRLRALRVQFRLTQQEVADKLNIHRTTYTKYETGVVTPDQQGLVELAEMFDVTVDYLLGRENAPHMVAQQEENTLQLSLQEQQLLQIYRQLTYAEQQELVQKVQKAFKQRKRK